MTFLTDDNCLTATATFLYFCWNANTYSRCNDYAHSSLLVAQWHSIWRTINKQLNFQYQIKISRSPFVHCSWIEEYLTKLDCWILGRLLVLLVSFRPQLRCIYNKDHLASMNKSLSLQSKPQRLGVRLGGASPSRSRSFVGSRVYATIAPDRPLADAHNRNLGSTGADKVNIWSFCTFFDRLQVSLPL